MFNKIKDFVGQTRRVIQISTKPQMDDYLSTAKVTGLGIILVGGIGFLIYLVFNIAGLFQA